MKTDIIIVNYNGGELLEKCISSVMQTTDIDFEIILVDNASSDNSHINCKKKFPAIKLIENKTNLGFCEANNIGIKNSKDEFIVLLNPDTEVESDWLRELYDAYKKHGEGLYQSKILSAEDKSLINTTGNMITLYGFTHPRGLNNKDRGQYSKFEKIGYASGACLFTSRKTMEKIGYLDSYLFAYYDDSSFAWRASHLGINSYYVPTSTIYHWVSLSFKKLSIMQLYLLERNKWYCLLTLYSKRTFYRLLPGLLIVEITSFFYFLVNGSIKAKILAYRDLFKDRKQIKEKFLELESKKKVSDKQIISNFLYRPNFKFWSPSLIARIMANVISFMEKLSRLVL